MLRHLVDLSAQALHFKVETAGIDYETLKLIAGIALFFVSMNVYADTMTIIDDDGGMWQYTCDNQCVMRIPGAGGSAWDVIDRWGGIVQWVFR